MTADLDLVCPTCGPTATEPHPRRRGVMRCTNCKEWLTPLGPHAPNCTDPDDLHRGVCRTDRRVQSPAGVDAPGGHVAPAGELLEAVREQAVSWNRKYELSRGTGNEYGDGLADAAVIILAVLGAVGAVGASVGAS